VNSSFAPIGNRDHGGLGGENSFWPSFTDIMMVITMIFLMATSLLVVRNWQLVAELRESVASEQLAASLIESTSLENATLEERLANAEQSNSILRLRVLKKEEELARATAATRAQEIFAAKIESQNNQLKQELEQTRIQLAAANLEIDAAIAQYRELASQVGNLNQQLAQQKLEGEQTSAELETAQAQIATLSASSSSQQESISQLGKEKLLLQQDIEAYNQQLLTLKGDYETVKSKYEDLIKPARSAKGKFIAEVYYVKGDAGEIIRYKQPGDSDFSRLSLAEVENRLDKLKQQYGNDLYIKIIIPEDSGLTYSEAWDFMRNLLVKYDYYYQE
jgi:chromosome segregation ATPase